MTNKLKGTIILNGEPISYINDGVKILLDRTITISILSKNNSYKKFVINCSTKKPKGKSTEFQYGKAIFYFYGYKNRRLLYLINKTKHYSKP